MDNTHDNRTTIANILIDNPEYRAKLQDILTFYLFEYREDFNEIVEYLKKQNEL